MNILVTLLIIGVALGTLFFLIGYGALFIGAFSSHKTYGVILLVVIGFSSAFFVMAGQPWYYALPFWFIPPIYAHFILPTGRNKKLAILSFWSGLLLFTVSLGAFAYPAFQNADIQATMEKIANKKKITNTDNSPSK